MATQAFQEVVKWAEETTFGDGTAPTNLVRLEGGGFRPVAVEQEHVVDSNGSFPDHSSANTIARDINATLGPLTLTPGTALNYLNMATTRVNGLLKSYCVGKSGAEDLKYTGLRVNTWAFNVPNRGAAQVTLNFLGKEETTLSAALTASAGQYTTSAPFLGYTLSAKLSGTVLSQFEDVTINGDNQVSVGPIGADKTTVALDSGFRNNTGELKLRKNGNVPTTMRRNGTTGNLVLAWTNGSTKHLVASGTIKIMQNPEEAESQAAAIKDGVSFRYVTGPIFKVT
jgi:hypothetical protein